MKAWQKKKMLISLLQFFGIAGSFLGYACNKMYTDKQNESLYWDKYIAQYKEVQK